MIVRTEIIRSLYRIHSADSTCVGFVAALDASPWVVLLAINVFLLLVGCVLDTASAILVLTPLILEATIDPGHVDQDLKDKKLFPETDELHDPEGDSPDEPRYW